MVNMLNIILCGHGLGGETETHTIVRVMEYSFVRIGVNYYTALRVHWPDECAISMVRHNFKMG